MSESEKLDLILSKVTNLDEKVTNLDEKVTDLDEKVTDLDEKVRNLDTRVIQVETTVEATKMILENEIRVNIQRVAEGHLDLSRNLHDAMRPSNEVEMLAIKVRMLESQMRELQDRISKENRQTYTVNQYK